MEIPEEAARSQIDDEPNLRDNWLFLGMYLFHDRPTIDSTNAGAHATVKELAYDANSPHNQLDAFLYERGSDLSAKAARLIERNPDNPVHVERCVVSAAFDLSRAYKQVTMGPLASEMATEIIRCDPQHIVWAPTTSQSFEATLVDWYDGAASLVKKDLQDTELWQRFQHAIDVGRTVIMQYPDVNGKSALSWADRNAERWLAESFSNTLPFVSDLLIQAAIGYARYHPESISATNLTDTLMEWLPYLTPLESSYSGVQATVTFGPELKKRREEGHSYLPTARWLEALGSFEESDDPRLLDACVEEYVSSPLLQRSAPGALHPSIEEGHLPERRSGRCGGQFMARAALRDLYHSHYPPNEYFSPASTMLQSAINVAGKTILADGSRSQQAIVYAAQKLNEASGASTGSVTTL